ncbi:MAG: aspartyl/glutamyl-tRNA amidotransferase subunit C [Ruminococcus sp.]|nr:aspartyl/glutamyl-tRNA amidotransferase subunit C [Ruminococcus sp.]
MITENDIMRVACLSKLEIKEQDIPFFIKELEELLNFAESMDVSADNAGVSPCPVDFSSLRADEVRISTESSEILSNSQETENGFFRLRKRA